MLSICQKSVARIWVGSFPPSFYLINFEDKVCGFQVLGSALFLRVSFTVEAVLFPFYL